MAVFFGVFFATKHKSSNGSGGASTTQTSNHVEGENKAGVVLIEYGDYQCPACKAYYPVVKQVVEKHKANIKFQFKNLPLVQIHKHAFEGARAAEAAAKQGKFWEMHDLLYENQDTWTAPTDPVSVLESFAGRLGLNVAQFKTDYASSAVNDVINADYQEATKIGANSTPTFVLNGKKLEQNPNSADAFEKLITDAIAAAQKK